MMDPMSLGDDGQSTADDLDFIDRSFETPRTPTSGSEDDLPHAQFGHGAGHGDSDEEIVSRDESSSRRKAGGYNSRIEQILYENPNLSILITEAGKSVESGGRYIVYTIKTGVCSSKVLDFHATNSPVPGP